MKNSYREFWVRSVLYGCVLMLAANTASALNVTPASGGGSIPATSAANGPSPAWTELGQMILAESGNARSDLGAGTFVLQAPAGFEFDTTVTPSISYQAGRNITSANLQVTSATTIAVTLTTVGSLSTDTLTIGATTPVRVRPISTSPLASGHIYLSSAGGLNGVTTGPTGTSFGNLAEVSGPAHHLGIQTVPGATTAGSAFSPAPVLWVCDQFGNPVTGDNSTVTATLASGVGPLQGTTSVIANNGVATFSNLVATNAETISLSFARTGIPGTNSEPILVSPAAASRLVFTTQPGSVTYGQPLNPQPVVRSADAYGNFSTTGLPGSRIVTLSINTGTGSLVGTATLDIGTAAGNGTVAFFGLSVSAAGTAKRLGAAATGFTSAVSDEFNVTPITVTGNVTVNSKVYDGTTNAVIATRSLSGVLPGETAALSGGVAGFVNKNVGNSKTVVVSGLTLTGAEAANYQLASTTVNTSASISPAPLQVTADNKTRPYGSPNPLLTASYIGLVGGETLPTSGITGAPALSTTAETNSLPANYPIAISVGTLFSLNYTFTAFNPGVLTVTKAPLIVAADNKWKTQGTLNPALTYSLIGLVNGDDASAVSGTPNLSTTATTGSSLGSYPITLSLGSMSSSRYTLTAANGTLSVVESGTLWFDGFDRPTEPGAPAPWIAQSGAWKTSLGLLEGGTNLFRTYGLARITNTWTDYAIETRLQFPAGAYGGGIGGRLIETNGARYAAWLYPENSLGGSNVLKLLKFQNWSGFAYSNVVSRPIQQVSVPPVGTGWHTLRLAFQNNRVAVSLDGIRYINVEDTESVTYPSGAVSVENWTETNSYMMSLEYVRVSVPASPGAVADAYSVANSATLKVPAPGVLANDLGDALPLQALLVSGPAHGTLVLTNNGGFTYTPVYPYTGPDSFTYRATDGVTTSSTASVSLTVTPNNRPVASADAYSASSGVALIVAAPGVLANDSDPDGQPLTAILVGGPAHGTLNLNTNGSFSYTSVPGYTGPDSFTYQASDGTTNSLQATVSITVSAVAPTLFSENFTRTNEPGTLAPWFAQSGTWTITAGILQGGTNNINSYGHAYLSSNWTDFALSARLRLPAGAYGGGISGRINPVNGARYAAWIYPEASPGGSNILKLLKFSTWNNFTIVSQVPLPAVGTGWHTLKLALQGNRIGVHLDDVRLITAADETSPFLNGGIGTEFWTDATGWRAEFDDVLVTPPSAPAAANDTFTVLAGSTLRVAAPGVLTNDSADAGPLTALLASPPASGSLTLSNNGGFAYTPTISSGPVTFTYRASDSFATSALATVTLNVSPNSPPVAAADSYGAMTGVPLILSAPGVLANDTDVNAQSLTAVLVTGPTRGPLTLSSNGSFIYTATNAYTGPDSFTYRASDGFALSSPVTVSINIGPSGSPYFSDTFARGTEPGPLSPWLVQSGEWSVTQGVLQAGLNPASTYAYAYLPTNWIDIAVQARVRFPAGGFGGGIGARLNPETGAHYAAWLYPETTPGGAASLRLIKFQSWTAFGYSNVVSAPIRQVGISSLGTNWHTLRLVTEGSRLKVTLNGIQFIAVEDTEPVTLPYGAVSAEMWTASTGYRMLVDEVTITPPPADNTPPAITRIVVNGGTATVTFLGTPSTQYIVQAANALGGWSNVATNTAAANGSWTYSESVAGRPSRFFRAYKP